jgi:hypothetical protein
MRYARTIAPLVGLLVVAGLASPAGARVHAATNQALFSAGLITSADVPTGWTSSKQADSRGKAYQGIKGCTQLGNSVDALRTAAPHKLSRTFTDTTSSHELTAASNAVYAFKTSGAATKVLNRFKVTGTTTCLTNVAKKSGGKGTNASTAAISSPLGTPDDFVGYQVTLSAKDQTGTTVTAILDIYVARVGRTLVAFSLSNADTELTQAPAIVSAAIGRLRAANA